MDDLSARVIMVQGTGTSVGKSVLATALCRIFSQDGYRVAPFKAQNMSLNAGVTPDGLEMGRAQVVQADAARAVPSVDMNPVLLKPEADYRAQLVVMGRPAGTLDAMEYPSRKARLWDVVTSALDRLRAAFEIVVVEGAGSPAEINLRQGDIVNMEVALYAQAPVLMVGDIDRGGVFASLYGTIMLLDEAERQLVGGLVINKFRGDQSLLEPGLRQIEELTGVPVFGVVPYYRDIYIPEEDAARAARISAGSGGSSRPIDVVVVALPHMSNFDDFDPIARERSVTLRYARGADELGAPDLVIIPGTKTTVEDLKHLRASGMAEAVSRLVASGTPMIGICGGYQMLGANIHDPLGIESDHASIMGLDSGLGLLGVETRFAAEKKTERIAARVTANLGLLRGARGLHFDAYEIHMGDTQPNSTAGVEAVRPAVLASKSSASDAERVIGYASDDGWVVGTYTHGMFADTRLRRLVLSNVARRKGVELRFDEDTFSQSQEFDKLAELVRSSLDMERIGELLGL